MTAWSRVLVVMVVMVVMVACGGEVKTLPDAPGGLDAPVADAPGDDAAADASDVCVPTTPATESCDGLDNDCNGLVDDVDASDDGLYDCQTIALFGGPGINGSSNFVAWLTANGSEVVRLQTSGDGAPALTASALAAHQVIILDRLTRAYSAAEADLLRDWVAAGGGLMVLSGYTGAAADYDYPNSLLATIGLAIEAPLTGGPVTTYVAHPITTGITSVTFSGGFFVDEVAGVTGGTNTVIATIGGTPVGMVQTRGAGRVFVWGDEWITFDSEWSSMPQIQTFWVNILGWLGQFV